MKKLLLFLMLFAASGCAVAPFIGPVVTGVVMWAGGEAHKYYDAEADHAYRSTKLALKELNLPITQDELRKDGYYIQAGENDRFKITIKKNSPHITLISIRVNFMGDKPFAELIYKTIDGKMDIIEFSNGHPVKIKTGTK